jgi:hypothetical protein
MSISLLIASASAGFLAALLPVYFSHSSLHGYVEWQTPWSMYANAVRDLFNGYTWRNRNRWFS